VVSSLDESPEHRAGDVICRFVYIIPG